MDKKFLLETLKLAQKGLSWTNPNPMVGAVIVKNGHAIGKGYHKKAGLPHAEIEALQSCQDVKGAILYVNLEPCVHFGKTPPCVDAIIKAGVKKVVCCTLDPNPKTHGQGIARLKKAGILTGVGLLGNEARKLNEAFFTFHEKKRPFVAIKFASSLDGKIATRKGDSKWITNEKARYYARSLRAKYQAVLVGKNTFLKDHPHLGVRIKGKKDPLKIVLGLSINPKNIQDLLSTLREKEIISVLVEGGGKTLGNFLDGGVVDKVYAFYAPILIGGEKAISIAGKGAPTLSQSLHLKNISFKKFDDNFLVTGYV